MNGPCEGAPASVEDLLDGRLSPEEEDALRAHLPSCATCREALDDETRLRGALTPPAPEDFLEDVMAGVGAMPRHRPKRRHGVRRLLLVLPALAAAAAIVILATLGGPEVTPEPPEAPAAPPVTWGGPEDDPDPAPSVRARDLARRARLLLAVAESSPELLRRELDVSGLAEIAGTVDLETLAPEDRGAVRRLLLLDEAWRNGAPVARAEIAWATGGTR